MWYRILPQVLNMSLTGSIVILFVLLARLALKKTPKIFSYALWGVVLFRLLCPVALTSDLSLLRIGAFADIRTSAHTSSVEYIPSDLVESIVNPQWMIQGTNSDKDTAQAGENAGTPSLQTSAPSQGQAYGQPSDPSSDQNNSQLSIRIATALWLTGILALLTYSIHSLQKLRRQLVGAVPLRDNIYLADHITTPFVLGALRPRIYLPTSLSEEQQTYILLHEQHHVRRLDHIAKLLAFAALCVHWFNPLAWLAFVLSIKDMEMSCDEAVLRQMGDSIRADYSASLLSLATGQRIFAGAPLAFGEGDTRDRIRNVLDWKKPRTWIVAAALILCGVLAVSLLTNPSQRPDFAAARYQVEQILYDAPQYSSTYMLETAPQYTVTSDYVLMYRSGTDDTASWQTVGALSEVEYSRTELYSLFDPLYCTAHEQLDQIRLIYRAEPQDKQDTFYLVMQTYKGDILLAHGYGQELTGHVRWLFALEKQSSSYDPYELNQILVEQYGEGTEYFALYETDTAPAELILGFHQGEEVGYAVFRYDTAQSEYILQHSELLPYSLTGLYTVELSQEDGYGENLQLILTTRKDMAAVRVSSNRLATSDFRFEREVTIASTHNMFVFACPDAMTLKNLHNEYIYDWSSEWVDSDERIIPVGVYEMVLENSDEEAMYAPTLHLQQGNQFYLSYDPLSSYLSFGLYTVKDGILIAVTDDGRYQYRFEIIDENTLRFLQEGSSNISLIDDRFGTEVTDQAIFRKK